jgi:hypothetical protein
MFQQIGPKHKKSIINPKNNPAKPSLATRVQYGGQNRLEWGGGGLEGFSSKVEHKE